VSSSPDNIAADEALETRPAAVPDWAKLTSTPTPCSTTNHYSVLASAADDELAGQQFETVRSKKAKRARNRTDSAENEEVPQLQQRQPLRAQNAPARRGRNLLVFGKSADHSSISAAQIRKKKAVFYIANINKDCVTLMILVMIGKRFNFVSTMMIASAC